MLCFRLYGESEIRKIKKINGVVSLLYWKGNPAIIDNVEIKLIRELTENYYDIKVEKTLVSVKN
jgi:hypothetical protein